MKREVFENKFFLFVKKFFSWLSLVFLGTILLLNIFVTARAWGNNGEDLLVIKLQSPFILVACLAFLLNINKVSGLLKKINSKTLLLYFLLYSTVISLVFYGFWNPVLNADSGNLYSYILDENTDPTYILTWPVNLGYLGVMLFSKLVFSDAVFGLFLINLAAFYLAIISLSKITKILFNKDSVSKYLLLILALFFPLFFETIFFYNDLLGIAFSLFAVLQAILLRKNNKIRHLFLLCFSITAMLMIRQNTLITLIAILIYLFFTTKKKNAFQTIAVTLVGAIVFLYSPIALQSVFSKIYGWDFSDKSIQDPSISWVAMGMLDQNDETLDVTPRQDNIAGWWNGYNRNCVIELREKCAEYSKNTIKSQLFVFASNPWRGIKFFFRKIASQWAEPSFQTPFFMSHCEIDSSSLSRRFLCRANTHAFSAFNNFFHLALLSLSFLSVFALHKKNKMTWAKSMLIIAVFGYFLFSIIWEAKSRYILLVFPLILPFAAHGIEIIPETIDNLKAKAKGK